jgi:2-dehydro-3-deoxyphosphogalactonate aldolase
VEAIGSALYKTGFRCIEVPLNSPQPFASIRRLRVTLAEDCLIGAGTVMTTAQVEEVKSAGGELIVMPHGDPTLIRAAKASGMYCAPGVATPTEGFAALAAGADALKLFPAEQLGPAVLKAWRAVFPESVPMVPVGGITPENLETYWLAGARGFGLGSALYRAGLSAPDVRARAEVFAAAATRLP